MENLWAPWRLSYIKSDKTGLPADFIEHADQANNDRELLVVDRTPHTIVMLNRYPYNNGHLLVAPRRSVAELDALTDDELLDAQQQIVRMIKALRETMRAQGFNVGLNLGRSAGAGLPGHLHWHIVPRWDGDTNFMTLMADINVVVQSLDDLWITLRTYFGLPTDLPAPTGLADGSADFPHDRPSRTP